MKQLIAFFSVLFAFSTLLGKEIPGYITVEGINMTEVRLMNMSNIFTAYGMPGHFVRGHSTIRSIDVKTQLAIGKIE